MVYGGTDTAVIIFPKYALRKSCVDFGFFHEEMNPKYRVTCFVNMVQAETNTTLSVKWQENAL